MRNNKKLFYNLSILLVGIICCSGFSFLMPFRIYFIALFGAIQFLHLIRCKKIKFIKGKNVLFLLLFIVYLAISLFYSLDRLQTAKFLVMYLSILFMIINSYDDTFHFDLIRIIELFCKIVAISIILNAIIPNLFSKYLYFIIDGGSSSIPRLTKEINGGIYSGLVGEKGEAAYLMVIGIIITLSNYFKNSKKNNWIWLLIFSIGLVLPAKRMLFAIAIIIIILFLVFWSNSKKRFSYLIAIFLSCVITAVLILNVPAFSTLTNRFINNIGDTTKNGRSYLWERAMDMYERKPTFGFGYGTYNSYTKYNGVLLSSTGEWNAYAHNIYYQLLGECGLIGFSIFIIIIFDSIVTAIKLYKKRKDMSNEDQKLLFIGINIIILNLSYGYSGNPIYYTNQAFVFFWGISLILYLKYNYTYLRLKKGEK